MKKYQMQQKCNWLERKWNVKKQICGQKWFFTQFLHINCIQYYSINCFVQISNTLYFFPRLWNLRKWNFCLQMQLVFSCFSLLDSFFISYMKGIITRTWQCLLLISIFVDSHVYMIKNSLITYIYIIIVFSHILFTTFVYVNLTENTNSINNSHLCILIWLTIQQVKMHYYCPIGIFILKT